MKHFLRKIIKTSPRKVIIGSAAILVSLLTVLSSNQSANAWVIDSTLDYNVALSGGGGGGNGWAQCADGYVITSIQTSDTSGWILTGVSFTCSQLKADLSGVTGYSYQYNWFGSGAGWSSCPAGYVANGVNGYSTGYQRDLGVRCVSIADGTTRNYPAQGMGRPVTASFDCPAGYWLVGFYGYTGGGFDRLTNERCKKYRYKLYAPTVTAVTDVTSSSTTLDVSFRNNDGASQSYNVRVFNQNTGQLLQTLTNVSNPVRVTGLTGGGNYAFQAQAVGDGANMGSSDWSPSFVKATNAKSLKISKKAIASTIGNPWEQQPIIQALDANDAVANVAVPITATLSGVTQSGTNIVNTVAGVATYTNLNWTNPVVGSSYTMTYSSPG